MIATYTPKRPDSGSILARCIGREYNFEDAFTINGVKSYEPVDINFPSSIPIVESELEFK